MSGYGLAGGKHSGLRSGGGFNDGDIEDEYRPRMLNEIAGDGHEEPAHSLTARGTCLRMLGSNGEFEVFYY